MELEKLIDKSTGRTAIKQKIKVPKRSVDSDLEKGDEVKLDHDAVTAEIVTSDEFDIPPTWLIKVTVDLEEL